MSVMPVVIDQITEKNMNVESKTLKNGSLQNLETVVILPSAIKNAK